MKNLLCVLFYFIFVTFLGCAKDDSHRTPASQAPGTETGPKTSEKPKSINFNYTIGHVDFKNNHEVRVNNKDTIDKVNAVIRGLFLDKTATTADKSYKDADDLLAESANELEAILKQNKFIKESFLEYKEHFYGQINEILRTNKYSKPLEAARVSCTVDPKTADDAQTTRNTIRCIDVAYEEKKPSTKTSSQKTVVFRTIRSEGGQPEFEGLKYGCFNPGQQNYIDDKAFSSTTTSLSVALNHHDNIKRGETKNSDSIYKFIQQALILMIEVDANDPLFKFPKTLDAGTGGLTIEEKEVLLKRGAKFEFSCKPNEFLPEIPNEFEYIPNFKADAVTPIDYKTYRVVRAKLVYPKN